MRKRQLPTPNPLPLKKLKTDTLSPKIAAKALTNAIFFRDTHSANTQTHSDTNTRFNPSPPQQRYKNNKRKEYEHSFITPAKKHKASIRYFCICTADNYVPNITLNTDIPSNTPYTFATPVQQNTRAPTTINLVIVSFGDPNI